MITILVRMGGLVNRLLPAIRANASTSTREKTVKVQHKLEFYAFQLIDIPYNCLILQRF